MEMMGRFGRWLMKWVGILIALSLFQAGIFSAMGFPGAKLEANFWVYVFTLGKHTLFPIGHVILGHHGIKIH